MHTLAALAALASLSIVSRADAQAVDPITLMVDGAPAAPPCWDGGLPTAVRASLLGVDTIPDILGKIDTTTGNGTLIGRVGDEVVAGLAWDPNHKVLYGSSTDTSNLLVIEPLTGATRVVGPLAVNLLHGLEYDSNADVLYGISNQASTRALYRINVDTGAATFVGVHGIPGLSGLAFDPATNRMYASEVFAKALYMIDLTTGLPTFVGPFNVSSIQLGTGLAFHPTLGLFASDNKAGPAGDDELFRIDPATGQATLVGPINAGNVLGLAFFTCEDAAAAPYGAGFPGTLGIPAIGVSANPVLGTTIALNLGNSLGAPTGAVVLFGETPISLPMFWGGTMLVLPDAVLHLTMPAAGLSLPLAIPARGSMCGVAVHAQAIEFDAGAALGLSNTAGLRLLLGM
jgi:hypothetical protein